MKEIRFSRAHPWCCPAYKEFYIQDRAVGRDIYGHDAYEYALFRRHPFRPVRKFRTRRQAYEYVSHITGLSQWDVNMGSYRIIANDRYILGVQHNDALYRIDKRTRTVSVRPLQDEQISGWDTYKHCIEDAKEIIKCLSVEKGQIFFDL